MQAQNMWREEQQRSTGSIEVRAFLFVSELFKERGWTNPRELQVQPGMSGAELLAELEIPPDRVAAIFVNRKLFLVADARVNPGDRVALVPAAGLIFPEVGCRKCRAM